MTKTPKIVFRIGLAVVFISLIVTIAGISAGANEGNWAFMIIGIIFLVISVITSIVAGKNVSDTTFMINAKTAVQIKKLNNYKLSRLKEVLAAYKLDPLSSYEEARLK